MLGVCYYPEHWPRAQWREDALRMRDIGMTYVRIAEFAWSRIEPRRDSFAWEWLDEAIEVLGSEELRVVMCTPTATPPKWLIDERPEILPWDKEGRPRRFGSRRHYCFSSPAWYEETQRICEAVAGRYGEHQAVVGWQLDNEYGCHDTTLSYAPSDEAAFRDWLARRYGTIAALNEAWGNIFWSQDYNDFSQIELPNLTVTHPNPSHALDFQRFSSDMIVAYNRMQAEIVRAHSPGRFITHNFMGFVHDFDHFKVAEDLDITSWDNYPLGHTSRRLRLPEERAARYARTGHPDVAAFNHDLYRGVSQSGHDPGRWWVMEHQAGPLMTAPYNPSPASGMVRLWSWETFAHGAEVVSYFRWRQVPFAQEQLYAGILRPDNERDAAFSEVAQVAEELSRIDIQSAGRTTTPVALIFDYEAAWILKIQPHGAEFQYSELVMRFYTALRRLGMDVDFVAPRSPLAGYRLVVAPTLPNVSEEAMSSLVESNATVVLGPRTGSRTESFQIPANLPPGKLQSLLALKVVRVESLPPLLTERVRWRNHEYPVNIWREEVETQLASDGQFDDGTGAIFQSDNWHYLAFWPDETFLMDYLEPLLREAEVATVRLPEDVRLRTRGKFHFTFNYGAESVAAPAPPQAQFVLGNRQIAPHDLAVWVEP